MRPPVLAGIIALAAALVVVSFRGGQVAERRVQQQTNVRANPNDSAISKKQNRLISDEVISNDQVLIANVASVSFGELWDVMRAAPADKRSTWARELEQLPPGTRRNAAIKSFYKIWGELDPAAAIEAVEKISDKRMRGLAFVALTDAAADSALPELAQLELRLGRRSSQWSATSVLSRWSAANPQAAARFLETHPDNSSGHFVEVTYGWANNDPQKAAEWLLNLKLPPLQNPKYPRAEDRRRLDAARGLLEAWIEKDTRAAATFAATHAHDPDINKALGEFTGALFVKSHDQAAAFILSLPDENSQRAALTEISDYIGGQPFVLREGGDDEEPGPPEIPADEVPAWLVTLPPNLWIDHAAEIFSGWDVTDHMGAEAWLRALPADIKSKAVADYCSSASLEQAPRVFELTAMINDPRARDRVLQTFLNRLSENEQDESELREKIAMLPITDQQKQLLSRHVGKRQ